MTAFTGQLVAISLRDGRYTVSSQISARLDYKALQRDGLIHDASENSSYIDEAAILQKLDVPKYFVQSTKWHQDKAPEWYASLDRDVFFVVYHLAQFESGLGD
jgi:hypothetical protein